MKSGWTLICFFSILLTGCAAPGRTGSITPPDSLKTVTPALIPSIIESEILEQLSGDPSRNILVLVHPRLGAGLDQELGVLEADLRNEDWAPVISQFPAESPEDLRTSLKSIYSRKPFAGIFLIGDFPYPRMWGYPIENPDQPGAADFYYMDLDGEWSDTDGDGFFDTQSDGTGDRQPEVFVGRLSVGSGSVLNRSELELVRGYLRRDHAYRTGNLDTANAALYATYTHTLYGWVGAENAEWTKVEILQSIQVLFPDTQAFLFDESADPEDSKEWTAEFWRVSDPNHKETVPARERFRELMGAGYDYLSVGIHGTSDAWGPGFFTNRDAVSVSESGGRFPVLIFSASCSTADLSDPDNLGGVLTAAGSLVFVGFSASSEMRWREFISWNQALAVSSVGAAFLTVQSEATPDGSSAVSRNVNWILLGDPTLRLILHE